MSRESRARNYISKHLFKLDPHKDFFEGNLVAPGFLAQEEAEAIDCEVCGFRHHPEDCIKL